MPPNIIIINSHRITVINCYATVVQFSIFIVSLCHISISFLPYTNKNIFAVQL